MSQHGYMRHTATPPLVLEMGQKLWQYTSNLTTIGYTAAELNYSPNAVSGLSLIINPNAIPHSHSTFYQTPWST